MKSLIIVHSYHHNNTLKIAKAFAAVLKADVKTTQQVKIDELQNYDLIGFGAGIDSGMHYQLLLDFTASIMFNDSIKKCFIFSTSAIANSKKMDKDHEKLREILLSKNYEIVGEFSCKGYNSNSFLKYIGGMNKKHPDGNDIEHAKQFATEILKKYNPIS